MPAQIDVERLNETVREESQQVQTAVAAPPQVAAAPAQSDMIAQLQQLSQLKTAGALTDEEFAAAKAKLLGTG